jgi:hypothetical protein
MARNWSHLPVAIPGGALMPHVSAKLRTELIDALFVASGGFERAQAWIEKSDENYGEIFLTVWAKGAARSTNVELSADDSVEALLAKLDAGTHAKVIDNDG